MPLCSVLQGCKLLAVLLRSLRMDACCSAAAAWFTAVDSDAIRLRCAQTLAQFNSELQLLLAYTHTSKIPD